MEEVIAKSVKTLYVVTNAILLGVSVLFILLGAIFMKNIEEVEAMIFGWIIIAAGIILFISGVVWLIYFIKMPTDAIKFKDGKLYFRNGVVCSPTEVDSFKSKPMLIDGELFGFGKLIISVNGKEFKLKYVKNTNSVVQRLFMLKAEYQIKENLVKQQQKETVEEPRFADINNQEETNG